MFDWLEWWHVAILFGFVVGIAVAGAFAIAGGMASRLSELVHEEKEFHGNPLDTRSEDEE